MDPNALRRSGTYDAVPTPRTRQESFVSAFELLQAISCDKVSMIASFKKINSIHYGSGETCVWKACVLRVVAFENEAERFSNHWRVYAIETISTLSSYHCFYMTVF